MTLTWLKADAPPPKLPTRSWGAQNGIAAKGRLISALPLTVIGRVYLWQPKFLDCPSS